MHLVNRVLRKVRGETCTIVMEPECTSDDILKAAVDKHLAYNWHLTRDTNFVLLYPDGQPVKNLPGSDQPFTLTAYREFMAKSYQKLVFFICVENHLKAGLLHSSLFVLFLFSVLLLMCMTQCYWYCW